ncbi:MAG: hypothetical protein UT30_C0008G0038 [Candidatus Uhrbacteria bacterium GW2011_GWF2_39_13]|uniref:LmbE family protein n=1 Tax=Candidatus Uhrbacteria bacterium GW2011_GWF2_39_13 TaxID=1618995 RepID=A0A0G0MVE4_9BACT|nr:MAG: hypothetical protein UT30_C0008G0038 [Candidatus Uhrbacteria bacterium GW2011_GWF2_39_13]
MDVVQEIRLMSIMAHQDDFEFTAAGTFALMRKHYGDKVRIKILTTTRGASGHHQMNTEETFRRRDAEARRSAETIGAEYECLKCLDGNHVEAQFFPDRNALGGLWNAIRKFRPDYIFCPPVINNPLAGIHVDHYNTAVAVRMLGYQLTVPHAYPVTGDAVAERVDFPLIINVDDMYARENEWHFCIDVSEVYDKKKVPMALCHESQIFEWLPWNANIQPPTTEQFKENFINRHLNINKRYGLNDGIMREFFRITGWSRKSLPKDFKTIFQRMSLSDVGKEVLENG